MKTTDYINCKIIKYQRGDRVQRRDAIKDYRPQIQEPIKQQYTPTYSEISQDNRSEWEKEVSRQIKADKAKNDKLYGNQHTWNWSAPFTNTRITKDNASTMFDFNKSAAMSTFATGIGVANPVATATSMAGSLVGAGIGNKIAGNKGALIGGFVVEWLIPILDLERAALQDIKNMVVSTTSIYIVR